MAERAHIFPTPVLSSPFVRIFSCEAYEADETKL